MAQRVEVTLVSDLTPDAEAQATTYFALDGTQYEIDLTSKEEAALRKSLDKYVSAARKVTRGKSSRPSTPATGNGVDTKAVRAWARQQGFQVTDRGRVPREIVEKFKAAH